MLLLVLILILIAFALLVIALFTGSVLWAWVSVAVSAVAALVLVVDALQRRSAVRAAAGADGGSPPQDHGIPEADRPEPEPATEILPVVRPAAMADAGGAADHGGPGVDPGGRPAPADGGERTVAVSQRQPPGSDARPPGAAAGAPPHTGTSSPSVTESGVEASTTKVGAVGSEAASSEATVVVPGRGASQGQQTGSSVDLGKGRDPREHAPAAQGGVAPSEPTVHGVAPADVPRADEPVGEAAVDVEPPEESREPTISAIVAVLPDEVYVVDEQPRYHVTGCRALTGRAMIPLPVREAVELGFTPCGWCAPDRTLAERHPARAQ